MTFLSDCDILYKSLEENDEVHQRGVAQFGRALRSGRRGRRFKSCHPDQKRQTNRIIMRFVFFIAKFEQK